MSADWSRWRNPWALAKARADANAKTEPAPAVQPTEKQLQRRFVRDEIFAAQRALEPEWGNEFAANRRLVNQHLDHMPAQRREAIEGGFTPYGGTRLLNDPETLRRLNAEARRAPAWLQTEAQKHGGERQALEALMREGRNGRYYTGDDAEVLQARYRDLVRNADA